MSDMHLFDPGAYTRGQPRQPRTKPSPPSATPVRLGEGGWRLAVVNKVPGAHLILVGREADRVRDQLRLVATTITRCRKAATPLTFEPGTPAPACPECLKVPS